MSWIQKLCEVYDVMAGAEGCNLLPLGFTQKKIKFNIIISADGEFVTAHEIPKNEQLCMVPTTPQADSRVGLTGKPFPLAEQLKYLVTEASAEEENPRFSAYMQQLGDWCASPDAPECLKTLFGYLEKKTLLSDLMGVPNLKLQNTAVKSDSRFVCFSVQYPGSENRLWKRLDVRESWGKYSSTLPGEKAELCYATGNVLSPLQKHPMLFGYAKLISGEDAGFPFQYKGHFISDRSATTVSNIASTKAHNALRWLIENQGFQRYGMSIVAWNTAVPILKEEDIFGFENEKAIPGTFESYAIALKSATTGYMESLRRYLSSAETDESLNRRMNEIVIMGLQTATNGRISITYYQEIPGNIYVERLEKWANDCLWEMPGKQKQLRSPTWLEICEAVIGRDKVRTARADAQCRKSATKLMRETQTRLLSCIMNGAKLPKDFTKQAFSRAVQPLAFTDSDGRWNGFAWAQCVATACALIRKKQVQENAAVQSPTLDAESASRDYLFGRLLAVAHKLELDSTEDGKTPTVSLRLMNRFVQSPASTWLQLFCKLIVHLGHLGQSSNHQDSGSIADRYLSLLGEIEQKFAFEERISNQPLSYEFLTGFSSQLRELYLKTEERRTKDKVVPYSLPKDRDSLFGCLLAVADICEWNADSVKEDGFRTSPKDGKTNALLFTAAYVSKPSQTWAHIHDKLIAYFEKNSVSYSLYMQSLISGIEQRFDLKERESAKSLGSGFLNGYLSMRLALRVKDGLNFDSFKTLSTEAAPLNSRDAAYGALLSLENQTERLILDLEKTPEENRLSNAMRFLSKAAKRPNEVTNYLLERMIPYQKKLFFPIRVIKEKEMICKIICENKWNTDDPLGCGYLNSFYTYKIYNRKEDSQ